MRIFLFRQKIRKERKEENSLAIKIRKENAIFVTLRVHMKIIQKVKCNPL